jgi:LPS-assembly lipoprotein
LGLAVCRRAALTLSVLLASGLLAACGFHLRGSTNIPFKTFYVGATDASQMGLILKRSIRGNGPTRLVSDPNEAEARLEILGETELANILTINRLGQATEYNLFYHIRFRVSDGKGHEYIPLTELGLKRLILANANATLAENNQILQLYTDMQADAAQQILRRVEAINPTVFYNAPLPVKPPAASPLPVAQ